MKKIIIHSSFLDKPDLKTFFKILSLPIGTKIILRNKPARESLRKYDGLQAQITSFVENRYVKIRVLGSGEKLEVPFDNILIPGDFQRSVLRGVYYFCFNYFFHSEIRIEKTNW